MKIDIDPTDDLVDEHLLLTDSVVMIHSPGEYNDSDRKALLMRYIELYKSNGNKIVYVHYYTIDKVFSFGIKEVNLIDISKLKEIKEGGLTNGK